MTAWTPAEDAIIREWYPVGGWKGVAVRLPAPRGRASIEAHAKYIGVSARNSVNTKRAGLSLGCVGKRTAVAPVLASEDFRFAADDI